MPPAGSRTTHQDSTSIAVRTGCAVPIPTRVLILNVSNGVKGDRHRVIHWCKRASAIAAAAIAVCLAGCSGVIFNSGPLGGQDSTGINCAPVTGWGGVVSYG